MEQIICKKCGSNQWVKNGSVRGIQRYRCKSCKCNFTNTLPRGKSESLKALAILLHGMGKCSFRMLGKILGVSGVSIYEWVRSAAEALPEPVLDSSVTEMEWDEMWHFVQSKKTNSGVGKRWIVAHGDVSPGLSVIVMLQRSGTSGRR